MSSKDVRASRAPGDAAKAVSGCTGGGRCVTVHAMNADSDLPELATLARRRAYVDMATLCKQI